MWPTKEIMDAVPDSERLRQILRDVCPGSIVEDRCLAQIQGARDLFPTPWMVLFALLAGTDCKVALHPEEKVAWTVDFTFRGVLVSPRTGEAGHHTGGRPTGRPSCAERPSCHMWKGDSVVERMLKPDIDELIQSGRFTVPNCHRFLRARYEFFRGHALRSYAGGHPESIVRSEPAGATIRTVDFLKPEREGFFNGTAAIDAYFSWLEHILVLSLPFVRFSTRAVRAWSRSWP